MSIHPSIHLYQATWPINTEYALHNTAQQNVKEKLRDWETDKKATD